MNRDYRVDFLKGLGIFLVVYGHLIPEESYVNNWIYSFHMPLFFILSGVFLLTKKQNFYQYFIKNLKSLVYPMVVFSFIKILLLIIEGSNNYQEMFEITINTITFAGDGVFWFLSALFISKLIYYFIDHSIYKNVIVLLCFIISLLSCPFLYKQECYNFFNFWYAVNIINRCLPVIVFLYIGQEIYKKIISKHINFSSLQVVFAIILIIANTVLCQMNGHVDLHYSKINNGILYYFFSVSTVLSLFIVISKFSNLNNFVSYYGKNSLIIMMTHTTFRLTGYISEFCSLFINCNEFIEAFFVTVIIFLFEILIIEIINRFLSFLVYCPNFLVFSKDNGK